MIHGLESVMLSSDNPKALADFYKEKVGLKCTAEYEMGEEGESGYAFESDEGSGFYINFHSELKGKGSNKQPQRYILNFDVDNIETEVERLKKENVNVIAETYHIENYGLIATFEDPDGNYFQLVQVRATES